MRGRCSIPSGGSVKTLRVFWTGAAGEFSARSRVSRWEPAAAPSRVPRFCPWPSSSGDPWGSWSFCDAAAGGLDFSFGGHRSDDRSQPYRLIPNIQFPLGPVGTCLQHELGVGGGGSKPPPLPQNDPSCSCFFLPQDQVQRSQRSVSSTSVSPINLRSVGCL